MIDRYEFYDRYGVRPTRIYKLNIGEFYRDEKKHLCLEVKDHVKNEETGFYDSITFSDGKETIEVDLAAHWDKIPDTEIKVCREGMMNLIRAVYARAVEDYEDYYLNGDSEIDIKPMPGESLAEFQERRSQMYKDAVEECEGFLGKLFIKYTKVRALWKKTHNPNIMAMQINDTPEHIACIIDRLGLNRSNLPNEEERDDRTVKLSSDFDSTFLSRL